MSAPASSLAFVDRINQIFDVVYDVGCKIVEVTGPIVRNLASRVHTLFQHITPFFNAAIEFAKSNLGIATIALSTAVIAVKLAFDNENPLVKTALLGGSIAAAVISGIFLMQSGILPAFVTPVSLV